jgi:hypothetical protein
VSSTDRALRAAARIIAPRMPCRLAAALCLLSLTQEPAPLRPFQSTSHSFQIDLPPGWRQIAPNEAVRVGEHAAAPKQLTRAQPNLFYAVGPVDEWLAGTFTSPWLYVVEQDNEWHVEADYAERLAAMWQAEGAASGLEHELRQIARLPMGTPPRDVVTALRTTTPRTAGAPVQSLDVHAPAGGRQITLSFTCHAGEFGRWEPEFRRWLQTLTFARQARGEQKLSDRLWTPVITGALVGLVLVVLYKHTHRRR